MRSYNTPEDAADGCNKKKLEFDSMVADATVQKAEKTPTGKSCEAKVTDQAEINIHATETVKVHHVETPSFGNAHVANSVKRLHGSGSVYRTKAGKWVARIPIRKVKVYLGTYTTHEEAVAALNKKRQDLDSVSPVEAAFAKELDPECDSKRMRKRKLALSESVDGEVTYNRPCGVYETAEIRNPMTNLVGFVGTSETVEEALEALNRNCKESNIHVRETVHHVETPSHGSADVANSVKRLRGSGSVYRAKAGKWIAQIRIRRSKVYLGTYTTYEEAEAALHKKRQDVESLSPFKAAVAKELDPECSSKRTRKQKKALSESMGGQVTCNRPLGVYQRKSASGLLRFDIR